MAIAIGRTITRSGSYLVRRVKQMAMALAVAGSTRAKSELIDGFLLRATASGGRGAGVVIDIPGGLILLNSSQGLIAVAEDRPRDWYDSRLGQPLVPYAYSELSWRGEVRGAVKYAAPSAVVGADETETSYIAPWVGAGVEARRSITFSRTQIEAVPGDIVFRGVAPFGVPDNIDYEAMAVAYVGAQATDQLQVGQSWLRSEFGSAWGFGPYIPELVDVRAGTPISRAIMQGATMIMVSTTFQALATPAGTERINHPGPGIYLLAHSRKKMESAWQGIAESDRSYEDGLVWQRHIKLGDLFPVMDAGPFVCAPRFNPDYVLTGDGNLELASEAYKVWRLGHYTGGIPPTETGRVPSFLTRLCVLGLNESIEVIAGVTSFVNIDWYDINPGEVSDPLTSSQLIVRNGVLRLSLDLEGNVVSLTLDDLDSSAGPDEMVFDGLPAGRSATRGKFTQPCALLDVQGQAAEVLSEWDELRLGGRFFSEFPTIYTSSAPPLDLDACGTRVRWGAKDLFFSVGSSGLFCWAKLISVTSIPNHQIYRWLAESEAPGAVLLSPTEIAFIGYKMSPFGRITFCVVDLVAETLTARGEILPPGGPLNFVPPHPSEVASSAAFQQPPSLSVAQQTVYDSEGAVLVEGVILLSFYPVISDAMISRDSGRTWQVHISDSESFFGVFYAPSILRTSYETGTAAAVPKLSE